MSEKKFSPEDALKLLRACTGARGCDGCPPDGLDCGNYNNEVIAAEAIEELLAQVRWIPVTERLPELIPCNAGDGHGYSESVQICTDGKKVLTAIYSDLGWIFDGGFWEAWDETVTHWRPVVGNLPWAEEGV